MCIVELHNATRYDIYDASVEARYGRCCNIAERAWESVFAKVVHNTLILISRNTLFIKSQAYVVSHHITSRDPLPTYVCSINLHHLPVLR
jgi:hypothetical protein